MSESAQTIDEAVATADGVVSTGTHVAGESGEGTTTPEHLMAAATASCLQQSIRVAASSQDVDDSGTEVTGTVRLTPDSGGGYTAHFVLEVSGLPEDVAQRVLDQAQQICPFTKALSAADLTVRLG